MSIMDDTAMPKIDTEAPDFTLPDQDGKEHTLSDYRGKWVLIYFYPKDDTPGCTKEACAIRDSFRDFDVMNAVVLGISVDTTESHGHFAKKYKLPFTLLADNHKKVVSLYGVWGKKPIFGRESENESALRTSFLIDPMGLVEKIYHDVKPDFHAAEVLQDLRDLENSTE